MGETPAERSSKASLGASLPPPSRLLGPGMGRESHPLQDKGCVRRKSRVDKCHRVSGWGRAQAGHRIQASDLYIGCDAGKTRAATRAEAPAECDTDGRQHYLWVPPKPHKRGGGRVEVLQLGR